MRISSLLLIFLLAFSSYARPLKIGKLVEERQQGMANLRSIGELIVKNTSEYDSYELIHEPGSKEAFIKMLNDKGVDIVIESLHTAVLTEKNADMEPLLLISRDGSVFVKGLIIARKDSKLHTVKDLSGKTIAIPNTYSTSTYHLVDRLMRKNNLEMIRAKSDKTLIKEGQVGFYVANDKAKTVNRVYLRLSDAGAICSSTWDDPSTVPLFTKEELKIIGETESVPGLFLMIRKSLPEKLKKEISETLLSVGNRDLGNDAIKDCSITSFHKINFDWHALLNPIN